MAPRKAARPKPKPAARFDLEKLLASAGVPRRVTKFARAAVIFTQGDPANDVLYLRQGSVKLSVVSHSGKEAVVAILGAGDFFGEGCLAGQPRRMATASALMACSVLAIDKTEMGKTLRAEPALSDSFLSHMLARNIRIEEDLIDQLFNSSEKRLARALLLLARYGSTERALPLPQLSQETLAEMVGTTRSRINFFMNKFRDLGFIEYNGALKVNSALLTVVLHE